MKVYHTAVFMGDDALRVQQTENPAANKAVHKKTIDGSCLKMNSDPVAAKRAEARKKAMKIVGDAFANELDMDNDMETKRQRVKELQKESADAKASIAGLEKRRAALRDTYGISEDSREEADLKLLEKEIRADMPGSDVEWTKEDAEKAEKIKAGGLTEYQQRSLEMLEYEKPYVSKAYDADRELQTQNRIISATRLERLKSQGMLKAQKQADATMDAASGEIISMLVDEAKEHLDTEAEEQQEKAKAEKQKQEEFEERVASAREQRKENEELTEEILEQAQDMTANKEDVNAAQQEVKNMINKMKLIGDDIMGAAVDASL